MKQHLNSKLKKEIRFELKSNTILSLFTRYSTSKEGRESMKCGHKMSSDQRNDSACFYGGIVCRPSCSVVHLKNLQSQLSWFDTLPTHVVNSEERDFLEDGESWKTKERLINKEEEKKE